MAFQLSPGVNVSEVDLTTVVPSVGTTTGGFAGNFAWGPVNDVINISNENQLVEIFGKPDANTFQHFFTASNFLAYGSNLKVIRSANTSARNSTTSGVGVSILNTSDYEQNHASSPGSDVFFAKYPGSLGNSLLVSLADTSSFDTWNYRTEFSDTPTTSDWATAKNSLDDEIHIVVVDRTGEISGTANTVLEKFGFISKASDAKNSDGSTNYFKEVINKRSKYIWAGANAANGTNWGTTTIATSQFQRLNTSPSYTMSGGRTSSAVESDIINSYDLLSNPESVDVSLLLAGPTTGSSIPNYLINIAETRKDCIVFLSPSFDDVVDNVGSEVTSIYTTTDSHTTSTYAVMDSAWKYQYDKYNDVYRWVPLNGDTAGLCVRTDNQRDPWFSPAGLNRGIIKNVVKLSWNPNKSERDMLYKYGINPVVTFPGEGTILYGDKTFVTRPSAFDRINVRRLFIVLEKSIAKAARSSLFEFNDEFTRAAFVNLVEPYLRDVQGRRGIYDFKVVCDTTNNTGEVIDRNEFVGDIYIKPARSINYIQLNFVAVRTGVSFEEVVGQF
jgi:Phage tail sheath protein subtilisin-like domain/Phage tail sheath C-terminal domain